MNNKNYLDTLILCGDIKNLNKDILEILYETHIDLKSLCKEIGDLCKENSELISDREVILKNIGIALRNNKDNIDEMKYIEEYRAFVLTYIKIYKITDLSSIEELSEYMELRPFIGIKKWKNVSFIEDTIYLNEKKYHAKVREDIGLVNTIEIDGKDMSIGGILFKNRNPEFVIVKSLNDTLDLIRRVVVGNDYDLALLARRENWGNIYSHYLNRFKDISTSEYLDLITYIEMINFEDEFFEECYNNIRSTDINIKPLLKLIYGLGAYLGDILKFLNIILIRLSDGYKQNEIDKYIKDIEDIFNIRMNCLRYRKLSYKMERLANGIEELGNMKAILEFLREESADNLSYIIGIEDVVDIENYSFRDMVDKYKVLDGDPVILIDIDENIKIVKDMGKVKDKDYILEIKLND